MKNGCCTNGTDHSNYINTAIPNSIPTLTIAKPLNPPYVGRFAPSPSGPLHLGSLLTALASWLDAKVHQGKWLLRIEDIDTPRVVKGADQIIMYQLRTLGLHWNNEVVWQSQRLARYQEIFERLNAQGLIYGCACTRQEITINAIAKGLMAAAGERPYAGTCRAGLTAGKKARSWRIRMPSGVLQWQDRWYGRQQQDVSQAVGDFIVRRADGLFAYQFVVVVDDHDQGVNHIVRGSDLLSSTARQLRLADYLNYPHPSMMHLPLVLDANNRKLSKQKHAPALDLKQPLAMLNQAWQELGFTAIEALSIEQFYSIAMLRWHNRFAI